jgi:poly(3-hydroxybutyrate) depolymerase
MQDHFSLFGRRQLLAGGAAVAASAVLSGLSAPAATAQVAPPPPGVPIWPLQTVSVTDNGTTRNRTFVAHIPAGTGLLPAVVAYHGAGQDGLAMSQHWDSVRDLCVIVCPNGLVGPVTGTTEWEFARPGSTTVPTQDISFTEAILNWLAATGRVDMERVYAAGFSSGASFTWQLTFLNRTVNLFRGYAPVSYVPNTWMVGLRDAAAGSTPKPLAFAMGTADYNWSLVPLGVQQPTPPEVIASWITRNNALAPNPPVVYSCGRGSGATQEPLVDPFAVEQLYPPDPSRNSAAISYLTVVNGQHDWPLTGIDPTGQRLVTHDIDWTKRLLSFWTTYADMRLSTPPAWTRC